MTTNKDDNPQGRTSRPDRADGQPQAFEREAARAKSGDERNPRNDRGQGSERTQAQGRGKDPDRG